jgi:alpha-galactosidase
MAPPCVTSPCAAAFGLLLWTAAGAQAALNKPAVPPRGWNSYDCFGVSNESVTLATAEGLVSSGLKQVGYTLLTLDEGWFYSDSGLCIDDNGRPVGSVALYPSSGPTGTMKPLSDALHAKEFKFGLWYMAGVPQTSFDRNAPIKGTNYTVRDIAINGSVYCPRWNPGWGWEVNHSHPAAQAW